MDNQQEKSLQENGNFLVDNIYSEVKTLPLKQTSIPKWSAELQTWSDDVAQIYNHYGNEFELNR